MNKKGVNGYHIIGIDENHNGFHLNHSFNTDLPLVVVGSLMRDYPGSQKANGKYERKGRVFTQGGMPVEELVKRATWYLSSNQEFYYSLISQASTKKENLTSLRAKAIASIIETFFQECALDETRTKVVLDMINSNEETSHIIYLANERLSKEGIEVPFLFRAHADVYNQAVKKADRVGYYLAGLRFKSPKTHWPYRSRKVPFSVHRTLTPRNLEDDLSV